MLQLEVVFCFVQVPVVMSSLWRPLFLYNNIDSCGHGLFWVFLLFHNNSGVPYLYVVLLN